MWRSRKWELLCLLSALGVAILLLMIVLLLIRINAIRRARGDDVVKSLSESTPAKELEEVVIIKSEEEKRSELVFFIEQDEWFQLDELLEGPADLRSQGFCSSLYVVQLDNNSVFAVKRLMKLKVSMDEFGLTMKKVGNLRHPNILPLVCYNSTHDEKLLVYRYQKNGCLLNLFQKYVEGKRTFPWKLRLSIAVGIARALNFIYQNPNEDSESGEIIPHGNLKLSNIMLNEDEEPMVSEYGYAKFIDPSRVRLFHDGYSAPEKSITKYGDVYSFGVILMELLTGKIVKSDSSSSRGIDLPKWVGAMVREEWTGEVFDMEVSKYEMYAFSLLNVSLKCIVNCPEERPAIAEVLEKIEEIVNDQLEGVIIEASAHP